MASLLGRLLILRCIFPPIITLSALMPAHPLHTSKSYSTLHNYMYRHYLQLKNTCIHIFSKMVPQGATHQVSLKLRVEIIDIMLPGHSKIH